MKITAETTNSEIIEEMKRLRTLYALKTTLRYKSARDSSTSYSESVAEHLFGMQIIAQYFLPLEDPEGKWDRIRIHELILFHELGEIETGDILFHMKTAEEEAEEALAAERVAARLPKSLQGIALEREREFTARKTPEAKFAYAVDKVEPIFEMFDESVIHMYKRNNVSHKAAMGVKRLSTDQYPYMAKFVDAWEERMVSLNAFPA